jgi:hypothetical protein
MVPKKRLHDVEKQFEVYIVHARRPGQLRMTANHRLYHVLCAGFGAKAQLG